MIKILLKISIAIFCFTIILAFVLPPRVASVSSNQENYLVIEFSKPVKRQEIKYTVSPQVHGEWRFADPLLENHLYRTLVFVPAVDFQPGTRYRVNLEGITASLGVSLSSDYDFSFITRPLEQEQKLVEAWSESFSLPSKDEITLMDIPLDWQDDSLSCEAASLKMALNYKGAAVSEDDIMGKIGSDLRSRQGNIWSDPNQLYVGDIDGKMCSTGYGVHWRPVAKAANHWRDAEAFSSWSLQDLTRELEAGNPVVIWGTMPVETLTDCSWHAFEGEYIKTYQETHVRLAVGFIGDAVNPEKIIINDPLAGKLYWPTPYFLTNWQAFNYSGVVVY
ncbi:MAG: C39 family peptidase [Spirochaetes bacterium]|nr:C39 family peptidase [Spirochaetota bacterium]